MYNPQLIKVIVHRDDKVPDMYGLHVPFENKIWMAETFVDFLFEYLPSFALRYDEFESIAGENAVDKLRSAARSIYKTKKFGNRGEFGELILHMILCEMYQSVPAVSKIYYKDSNNDTVKGFDAVHVVDNEDGLELWLGEVKFYSDAKQAVRDVVQELNDHFQVDFLRDEFMFITNKIDGAWPHAETLKKLLNPKTSLDEVFPVLKIPVLLTYDSEVLANSDADTEEFRNSIISEFDSLHDYFIKKVNGFKYEVHLYLLPLKTKERLVELLDKKLQVWQQI